MANVVPGMPDWLHCHQLCIIVYQLFSLLLWFQEKILIGLENSAQIFNVLSDLPGEVTDIEDLLEVSWQMKFWFLMFGNFVNVAIGSWFESIL